MMSAIILEAWDLIAFYQYGPTSVLMFLFTICDLSRIRPVVVYSKHICLFILTMNE